MKKLILTLLIGMFLISLCSAPQTSLGVFERNKCVTLIQLCGDCTYNNITSVIYPNSTIAITDLEMTKRGAEFNYTFCLANETGDYLVNGVGDLGGVDIVWAYDFIITENGKDPPSEIVVVLFIGLFLAILAVLISLILYTIGHFVEQDFDVKDLTYNLSAYFVLWGVYLLGREYMGNLFINNFLELLIAIGAITNVLFPIIVFVLSITIWKLMEMKV